MSRLLLLVVCLVLVTVAWFGVACGVTKPQEGTVVHGSGSGLVLTEGQIARTVAQAASPTIMDVAPKQPRVATKGNGHRTSPTITDVAPKQGTQGQTLNVTIAGANLNAATSVSFGNGITVSNPPTVISSTQITVNITLSSGAALGARNVSVTTPGGTATRRAGFTVNPGVLTITSINPNEGMQGQTLDVAITGTYLAGATSVSLGAGVTVNSYADSDTPITANITIVADATTGTKDVSVTTPGGTVTRTAWFTVVQAPPTITSVDPGQGALGQTPNPTLNPTAGSAAVSGAPGATSGLKDPSVKDSSQGAQQDMQQQALSAGGDSESDKLAMPVWGWGMIGVSVAVAGLTAVFLMLRGAVNE